MAENQQALIVAEDLVVVRETLLVSNPVEGFHD